MNLLKKKQLRVIQNCIQNRDPLFFELFVDSKASFYAKTTNLEGIGKQVFDLILYSNVFITNNEIYKLKKSICYTRSQQKNDEILVIFDKINLLKNI